MNTVTATRQTRRTYDHRLRVETTEHLRGLSAALSAADASWGMPEYRAPCRSWCRARGDCRPVVVNGCFHLRVRSGRLPRAFRRVWPWCARARSRLRGIVSPARIHSPQERGARLEVGQALRPDVDGSSASGITAAVPSVAADREGAEAADFETVPLAHGALETTEDGFEDRRRLCLGHAVLPGDLLDKLDADHGHTRPAI